MSFGGGFIDPGLCQLNEKLRKVDELLSRGQLLKPFEVSWLRTHWSRAVKLLSISRQPYALSVN
jgi:hypothetical protein